LGRSIAGWQLASERPRRLPQRRKTAVLFHNTLRYGMIYADPGATHYEDRYRQRVLYNVQRRAKSLGFVLQPLEPDAAQAGVS
jgi:transposase